MKKLIFFLALSLSTISVYSQDYLGDSVEYILNDIYAKDIVNEDTVTIKKIENSNDFIVTKKNKETVVMHFYFDEKAMCNKVVVDFSCKGCLDFYVDRLLLSTIRDWKKVNNTTYVSKKWFYRRKATKEETIYSYASLQIKNSPELSLTLTKHTSNKKEWKKMLVKE